MTRTTLKVCIALLTFSLGVACVYLWLFERATGERQKVAALAPSTRVVLAEPLEVEFCRMVCVPDEYDGKIVRVRANYMTGMHGAMIRDLSCLTTDTQVWVSLSPSMWEELRDAIDRFGGPVEVVFVGRFARNHPSHTSDSLSDTAPYRFELHRIESTSRPR